MKRTVYILIIFILAMHVHGQSFSIYSVYRYGDELSKEQYKKIHRAEWHKQEANKLNDQIVKNKRSIKVVNSNHNFSENKRKSKMGRLESRNLKLDEKRLENIKLAHDLFFGVYTEKIVALWGKYESRDPALSIIKAMENNGNKLIANAREQRNLIAKDDSREKINQIKQTASNMEEKGLDMISSALEGYYNYELELLKMIDEGVIPPGMTMNEFLDSQEKLAETNNDSDDIELQPVFSTNTEEDENSEIIIITKDAPIAYLNDDKLLNLILDNYNLDTLNEEVVISKAKLVARDLERIEKKKNPDLQNEVKPTIASFEDNHIDTLNNIIFLIENKDTITDTMLYSNVEEIKNPTIDKDPLISNIEDNMNFNQSNNSDNDIIITDNKYEKEIQLNNQNIEYRIQIAACREPLEKTFIENLYKGGAKVKTTFEDNWYKYTIDGAKSLIASWDIALESGVEKAFVAVYFNGKRIDMKRYIQISLKSR